MKILSIDPGDEKSAWVLYEDGEIIDKGIEDNHSLLKRLKDSRSETDLVLVIEMIASYGMAVGRTVFETCVWIGRFHEAWGGTVNRVYRADVKLHLCKSMKANDSNVRQALIDKFGPPGTKNNPGVTYGISKDMWSALAIAVTYDEALKL